MPNAAVFALQALTLIFLSALIRHMVGGAL